MVQPNRKALTPEEVAAAKQASEGALKRALSQTANDILRNTKEADLIEPDANSDAVKGGANEPGGWLHAPAYLELFAAADRSLTTVGNAAGIPGKKMERVKARLVPGTHLVVLTAVSPKDLSGLPVNRWPSSSCAFINLFPLLGEAGLTVPTGWRERYDVAYVPDDSPLAPALVIDLSMPLERRAEPVPKKKSTTKPGEPKKNQDETQSKTGESGQSEQPQSPAEPPLAAGAQDQEPAQASTESK